MAVACFFFISTLMLVTGQNISLQFQQDYHPPMTPSADAKEWNYSVPLNQIIFRPIIVLIVSNHTLVTNGDVLNSMATVNSLPHPPSNNDSWAESGGELCQNSAWWLEYPERYNRQQAKVRCVSPQSPSLMKSPIFKGKIIIDRIYHTHTLVPPTKRILRISIPDYEISIDTNPFSVTKPANHLAITKQPPLSVLANHDFDVEVEIRGDDDKLLRDGIDSVAYVQMSIPYNYKLFYADREREMLLASSEIRLQGENVITDFKTQDMIFRQRATNGQVNFTGVRILDIVDDLQLNITLTMGKPPWERIPACLECFTDIELARRLVNNSKFITFKRLTPEEEEKILPISFTRNFTVIAQTVAKLVETKKVQRMFVLSTNNETGLIDASIAHPIINGICIDALDSSDRHIYSGPNSKMSLTVETDPTDIPFLIDKSTNMIEGHSSVFVSIGVLTDSVRLKIYSKRYNVSYLSPAFRIIGNITIGHFGRIQGNAPESGMDSHINTFIRFAINDVNNGLIVPKLSKKGIHLNLRTVNIPLEQYPTNIKLRGGIHNSSNIRFAIISVPDTISKSLAKHNIPFIRTGTSTELSNSHLNPHHNTISWSDETIWDSAFQAIKERLWTDILIIKYEDINLPDIFYSMAAKYNISIRYRFTIKQLKYVSPRYINDGLLLHRMRQISETKLKIFFLFVPAHIQPIVLREAYLAGLSSLNGFQWILFGKYANAFPFENQSVCRRKMECTLAFSGTYLYVPTYNVSGYQTENWKRVLNYYFKEDRALHRGVNIAYHPFEEGALMGLGYDAVHLYAKALLTLIEKNQIMKSQLFTLILREITIDGLTGKIHLDHYGNRIGFFSYLAQINPMPRWPHMPKQNVLTFVKCIMRMEDGIQLEIPYQTRMVSRNNSMAALFSTEGQIYNTRRYISFSGMVGLNTQMMMPVEEEPWPPRIIIRKESVLAPYACNFKCGDKLKDPNNVNVFDRGECMPNGKCKCFDGYFGKSCKNAMCQCKYGVCFNRTYCICHKGYSGSICGKPFCAFCKHGVCVAYNVCKCNSVFYIGKFCDAHIFSIFVPLILGIILMIGLSYFFISIKEREYNTEAKQEWLVDWNSVDQHVTTVVIGHKGGTSKKVAIYEWKEQNWYIKRIPNRTIPPDDKKVISEMLQLTKSRHYNLIQYGGCCLTYPNVSLFLEVADKGSITDILANETFEIGWEFGFSFLKDICSGMEFLHDKSEIKSHGRLKSSNCLVDKRWTVRLSGFGAPTIRYGNYRIRDNQELPSLIELFWTAPELLGDNTTLDGIKSGTPQGDVYSFSIIACEIATKASPYSYELQYLNEKSILNLVRNTSNPANKHIRRVWENIGGAKMIFARPILKEHLLPHSKLSRKLFKKMLEESWNEKATSRPTFSKLGFILNQMHPIKGELIDKLIHLLETYSNNLEVIVVERTKELELNKAKAEQLLSQMLPVKVANELKQGGKVMPELFECATVFFSDIVNFGRICRESKPMEIVDFLNEIYNEFDAVLDDYDVYKVESICDSYMVVSGIPEKNEDRHAGEIATMALDMMSHVTGLEISHMRSKALQLRIGMHSGPVVSGVVGKLMPRYCLFGDTVNTASRMQSSSYALRIQVSENTAALLVALGGYKLECRGKRDVKGRGIMTTYWLWGKDTFAKELPDLSLAVPLTEHKFK